MQSVRAIRIKGQIEGWVERKVKLISATQEGTASFTFQSTEGLWLTYSGGQQMQGYQFIF